MQKVKVILLLSKCRRYASIYRNILHSISCQGDVTEEEASGALGNFKRELTCQYAEGTSRM